jgi:oligo-1,6-glucosidase
MMRWWLDRGVDGFRMDVINFISKADGLPDAPNPSGARYVNAFQMFADGPHVHGFLAEMNSEVFSGRDGQFLTVGEMPGVTPEQARLYTGEDRGELNMVFQFEHVQVDQSTLNKFDYLGLDRVALKNALHRWQLELAAVGWNSLYWNNHDQPRAVSRFGDDDPAQWYRSATALATILHGMKGTPYIYQGEELGMTNYPFSRGDEHRDPEAANYYASVLELGLDEGAALTGLSKISRDNARTPMQWDASAHAGFTTGDPWLPVNPNHTWLNAAAQQEVADSVFAHYRRLIQLRHDLPIFVRGDFTGLFDHDPHIWAYTRSTDTESMLVVANCGTAPGTVTLGDAWVGARLLLSNSSARARLDDHQIQLDGWDARIYLKTRA